MQLPKTIQLVALQKLNTHNIPTPVARTLGLVSEGEANDGTAECAAHRILQIRFSEESPDLLGLLAMSISGA